MSVQTEQEGSDPQSEKQDEQQEPYREERDLSIKPVAAIASGFVLVLVLISLSVGLLRSCLAEGKNIPEFADVFRTVDPDEHADPGIEIWPSYTLDRVRSENAALLRAYKWLDQPDLGGPDEVARIPIERAMEIIAERGVPEFQDTTPPPDDTTNGGQR